MPDHKLPRGFRAAGIACGIKQDRQKLDLALFASDAPCSAAGVFTQNRVCGAPVVVSRERVPAESVRAVIINSGNANACTGQQGLHDARLMTKFVAEEIGCDEPDVLVCSTGIIGHFLPMDRLRDGIRTIVPAMTPASENLESAARGMMTTDTFPKLSFREFSVGGQTVRITGVAKGAAMIAPNMATMLAVVMTDAVLSAPAADAALRVAANSSFNCISVEGHTSTSDTVLLLANGAGNVPLDSAEAQAEFQKNLNDVCAELAQAIIRDGEGADHFVTIDVSGLPTREEAHRVARAIANSALVKTAITGADPNWGRIVSAAGYAGVDFREEQVSLWLNDQLIYEAGAPTVYDEEALSRQMRDQRDVHIDIRFTLGEASVRFWTTDLTAEYVRLNSDYTT